MFLGLSLQTYFSIQHVQAATYLARRAVRLERRHIANPSSSHDVAIKGYASSSLFTTVAFLEALANEIFADAEKSDGGHLRGLDEKSLHLIAQLGQTESVERAPVLAKFDVMLRAAGLEPIGQDKNPGQDLSTAVRLRNELMHYKAEWLDMGTTGMVRPGNLAESKLAQQMEGRFPHRPGPRSSDSWLGGGCAVWAVRTAVAYTDEVFLRLGLTPLYEHVRAQIALAKVTPNPSLNLTRYGKRRKPGLQCASYPCSPGLRRSPPRAGWLER